MAPLGVNGKVLRQLKVSNDRALYSAESGRPVFGQTEGLAGRPGPGRPYKTPHRDEAINLKVEVSAKDFEQRITILSCQADERGLPVIGADAVLSRADSPEKAESGPASEDLPEGGP